MSEHMMTDHIKLLREMAMTFEKRVLSYEDKTAISFILASHAELLAACQESLEWQDEIGETGSLELCTPEYQQFIAQLKTAIAKAKQ